MLPALRVRDTPAKHPFLMQRQCRALGAWSSHSGQDDANPAGLPLQYQFGFAQERQACQNPAGFKTLQCYGTLGSAPISWEESGSAAMFIVGFPILGVNYKIRAWNEGAAVSAPRGLPPHYGLAGAGSTFSLGMKSEKRRLCQRPDCRTRHPNTKRKEAPPALGGWPGTTLGGSAPPAPCLYSACLKDHC